MSRRRARGGNVRSKYYGDGNLQIIDSTGFISTPSPAKNFEDPKNLDLQIKKGETEESAKSLSKNMTIQKDDASTKKCDTARNKDSMQFKHNRNQQKKDIPKNVGSHYLSNFLALSQTDKTLPKVEIQKHSQYFKNKPSSSEIASGSKISVKDIPTVPSEQKFCKAIPTKTPTKTSAKKVPQTKNEIAHKIKKKTDIGIEENFDSDYRDLRFLSHNMERSRVKDKFPEHLKESPYCDFEYSSMKENKLREKPGSSRKFGSPYAKDSSFLKKERYSSRHSSSYVKYPDLRNISKSSREYLDRERYYKSKSDKYDDRKKDYKWPKMEMHSQSKYSWYNKDYLYKKKYGEKPHSSKMRRDYSKEKRDFNLEDYEEVVSMEDSNDDLKVPVHFRKCLVRYLSYAVYNYFRPKWYFLSRKRYVVNCLYATGKKGKVSEKKLDILEPCPEEVAENEEEADNATIVDEETIKDELLVYQEEIENVETIDHVLLNDGETIEDASDENIETIHVTLLNTDSEETIGDAHGENVVTMDDALLDDDNGDVGKKVKDAICIVIDDQKESDDAGTVQDGSKEEIDVGVAKDNKEKVSSSSSVVLPDETEGEDICILHEKVTKQNIAKCVQKFNDAQKQSNKITRNYLKLQQISSKKNVPNKTAQKGKDNLSGVGNDTKKKVQNENANSLQTNSNQASNKDQKDPLVFRKCDSSLELNSEFKQGASAIQSNLSEWNSHLIGLEYMLEVQDNVDEKVIKKYHCGLCTEDFPHQETIVQVVIQHITSYKHMCNYMAKHFPSSDYNFSESVKSYVNEIMLQTCCEEINHKLGYNFMCIVKENFFQKEYENIKENFSAMKHWGESDIDIFPKLVIKQLESDVCKDAGCVIEDIISRVVPPEPKETFFIPQTIVSTSRRASPKDKVKDILKTSESVVNRSSQNTLIVLTTPSVPAKTPSIAGLSSPKKLAASSIKNNKALMNPISKGNIQGEELTSRKEQTQDVVIDPNLDKELKRNQDSGSILTEQDGHRVVRLRTSYIRPLELGDSDEEEEVGLNIPVQGSVEIGPSIEGVGVKDNLQAEEISDNDFSDIDEVEVHSSEVDKAAPKSQKYPHKKSMHSKYCPKRKAWIRSDSQQRVSEKESLRNVHSPSSEVSTIGKPSKRYSSHFHKKYDECSQDSYISSASKRRRRSPSSSSPSLEEFLRKLSPSPVRKLSPLRVPSSYRKPIGRRNSRSPYRKHSRSPTSRRSRSPYRKRSKSPFRRRSKSPVRRRSKSPIRRRSSPYRKRSRSPVRRKSRSPIRKLSRSPIRRRSRSPRSKSPLRRRSRSPYRSFKSIRNERSLRSPVRKSGGYKISRSPDKPPQKYSRSPSRQHARPRSPLADSGRVSRIPESYKRTSSSILPHHHSKTESRKERNDLEEISDEDESKYFNTNTSTSSEKIPQYMDEIIQTLPESARIMLVKVMQRFSITNINVNDPSFYELMKFVASHSSEIQHLMSQPSALPEMSAQVQSKPSTQSQESFLHQYILTGMKGNSNQSSEAGPSSANVFPGTSGINFQQPPLQPMAPSPQFLSHRPDLTHMNQFGQPVYQQPTSSVYPVQGMLVTSPNFVSQQQHMAMNIPMAQQPQQFQQDAYKLVSPSKPTIPPPQPKRTSEGVFQDLKATVSKIFGGEDALAKLGFKIPGFNDHPVEAKYSGSSQNVPTMNPGYQSSHDNKMGQYFKKEAPTQANDNFTKSYAKKEQVFLSETSREASHVPPPDTKVSFCDVQRAPMQKNLFPVVNNSQTSYNQGNVQASINDAKKSLAQRLAAVLVKVGMVDVPAHLLQEMLMKIGAFSLNPPQDISEGEILTILRKLKYVL